MTVPEIQKLLIHGIAEINDLSFLNTIKTILDAKTQPHTIILSAEQRLEIQESKKEIDQGIITEQAELDKELDQWLSEG